MSSIAKYETLHPIIVANKATIDGFIDTANKVFQILTQNLLTLRNPVRKKTIYMRLFLYISEIQHLYFSFVC